MCTETRVIKKNNCCNYNARYSYLRKVEFQNFKSSKLERILFSMTNSNTKHVYKQYAKDTTK